MCLEPRAYVSRTPCLVCLEPRAMCLEPRAYVSRTPCLCVSNPVPLAWRLRHFMGENSDKAATRWRSCSANVSRTPCLVAASRQGWCAPHCHSVTLDAVALQESQLDQFIEGCA